MFLGFLTFPGEVTEVEHGREPLVVVSDKVDVFLDAHDAGVGEGGLQGG